MKIALLTASNRPIPATMGGATQTMMTHLIDVNEEKSGHEFVIFSYYERQAFERSKEYKHTRFFYYHSQKYLDLINSLFWRVCRKMSGNRIYIRSAFAKWSAKIIKKEQIDAVILEGQDSDVQYIRSKYEGLLILHMHIDFLNSSYSRGENVIDCCDGLIAISEFCKRRMMELRPTAADKIFVVKNTVDVDHFTSMEHKQEAIALRDKIGIKPNQKLLSYCGRISPEKGVLELVRSLKKLGDSNIKLMIIGSSAYAGSGKNKYIEEVEQEASNYDGGVCFTGYINQKELPIYLTASDICVVPSICNEAAGNVTIEALGCEVPVVASSQGGIPEYADLSACRLIDYNENFEENLAQEIHELLYNEDLYHSLKSNTRKVALCYNKYNYYDNFIGTVKQISKR